MIRSQRESARKSRVRNSHKACRRLPTSCLAAAIASVLSGPVIATTANWTAGNGNYADAANWDTNPIVPLNNGVTYDVFIPSGNRNITFDSLVPGFVDSLNIGSGADFITDSGAAFTASMTSANGASLIAEDGSALNLGSGNLDASNLIVRKGFGGSGGATITTSITSWTGASGFGQARSLSADGAGSLLDLSSLTQLERGGSNTNADVRITASDGGRVDLSSISAFDDSTTGTNGGIDLASRDAGSEIDIAGITTISDANIEVRDGGDITASLVSITGRSQLLKRGVDDLDGDGVDMIDLSALVTADNTTFIAEDGATLNLGTTSINQSDLIARKGFGGSGGATLTTAVTSYVAASGFAQSRAITADGAGSLVDLSTLTQLERGGSNTNADLRITASDGGTVDLSTITAFADSTTGTNGGIDIASRDAGSLVDISGVTSISDANIEVRDGGDIAGQLQSITGRSQLLKRGLDDNDGDAIDMIDLSALVSADNTTFVAEDGATLNLGTTSINHSDLIARKGFGGSGGATLTTAVTSYVAASGFAQSRAITADGAGSLVDLSLITQLERGGSNTNADLRITASDGGSVDLSGITAFTDSSTGTNGGIDIASRDAGSEVDISGVSSISDVNIEVRDGGDIKAQLTSLTGRSQLLKRGVDDADGDTVDMIDLSLLAVADNTSFIAEDGATLDLGTTSINATDLIARSGFGGNGGALVTTSVTSYTGANGFAENRNFTADGAGSLVDLSNLTHVERGGSNTNADITLTAENGGRVDLSNINSFADSTSGTNGGISIVARDAGSEIDLAELSQLDFAEISIDNTARVELGKLASFDGGTIDMRSTDVGAHDLHLAASFALGENGVVDVASSTAAVVVAPGSPAGAADGSLTVTSGGTLSGSGTVIGTLINQGQVQPGNSPGILSVDGDYVQDSSATLALEIGGLLAGDEFDVLDISGTASLAGILELSLFGGYAPAANDSFVILLADAGISGMFDAVSCSNCSALEFEIVYGVDFVSLNAVAIPLPPALWLFASILPPLLIRKRRSV